MFGCSSRLLIDFFSQLIMERRWVFPLVFTSLLSILFLVTTSNMGLISSTTTINTFTILPSAISGSGLHPPTSHSLPRIAYLISGSKGDVDRLWRTLFALYHPRNYYVVHIDRESPESEREELTRRIKEEPVFRKIGNVEMIIKANIVTYRGPTMVANTLHACAVLLKRSEDWDWFINLSASDYPLVTQDDILRSFSMLPRNLNFVEHTSKLGWKESQRAKPMIIDPGLYKLNKSDIFWMTQTRDVPDAFKLFTGSAWVALTRDFVEYCVWGWDNLPRTLLMYYANFISTPEGYFQTVICNSPEFSTTVVNHDVHYISWDNPPKQHPRMLTIGDFSNMVASNAPFARKFKAGDGVLDRIDVELLGRKGNRSFTAGGWCRDEPLCSEVGDVAELKVGPGFYRLRKLMDRVVWSKSFSLNQCKK